MNNNKRSLYIIGGPARAGKTKTLKRMEMEREKSLIVVSTDNLRFKDRFRNLKIGDVGNVALPIKQPNFKSNIMSFDFIKTDAGDDEYALMATRKILDFYDRENKFDILIEGVAIKADVVKELKPKNLIKRTAFLGYSNEGHIDCMKKSPGYLAGKSDEEFISTVLQGISQSSVDKKASLDIADCKYFDCSCCAKGDSFEERLQKIIDFLLAEQ